MQRSIPSMCVSVGQDIKQYLRSCDILWDTLADHVKVQYAFCSYGLNQAQVALVLELSIAMTAVAGFMPITELSPSAERNRSRLSFLRFYSYLLSAIHGRF